MSKKYSQAHPVAIYIYANYVRYHYIRFGYYYRYDIDVNDVDAFKTFENNLYKSLTPKQSANMTKLIINTPTPASEPLVIGEDLEPEYKPLMYLKDTNSFIKAVKNMD